MRPLTVERVDFGDGTQGYSADGTPVDCVRFAQLGLIPDFQPQIVVSGINHGANLGDDIAYSGTVAAAFEGLFFGLPSIAVSQQSLAGEIDFRIGDSFDFEPLANFVAKIVANPELIPIHRGTLLNINGPGRPPNGVRVAGLGRRIYLDEPELKAQEGDRRQTYVIYGVEHEYERQSGTDFAAIADGYISITPVHFDLTDTAGIDALAQTDFEALLS
jgi:5'-nucleotidase